MESLWSSSGQVYSFHFTNSKVKLAFKPLHSGLFKSFKENLIKDKMLDYKLIILFLKGLHLFLVSLVLVYHLCIEIKNPMKDRWFSRYADVIVHRLLLAALEKSDWWKGGETSSILFNNSELKVEFVCIHIHWWPENTGIWSRLLDSS